MHIKLFGGPSDGHVHTDARLPVTIFTAKHQTARIDFAEGPIAAAPIHQYNVIRNGASETLGIAAAVYASDMIGVGAWNTGSLRRAVRWLRRESWKAAGALALEIDVLRAKREAILASLSGTDPDNRPDLRDVNALKPDAEAV